MNSSTQQQIIESVQNYTGDAFDDDDIAGDNVLFSLLQHSSIVPAWWSRSRDKALRGFWKKDGKGPLAIAMYVATSKLNAIPFTVKARNPGITSHVQQAEQYDFILRTFSGGGDGVTTELSKFFEDYIGQDNGGFLEIISNSATNDNIAEPLSGMPLGVRHLDASRCIRTSSKEYPVVYVGDDGKNYKFHFTRILFGSQQPSADIEMNGVGYCSISKAIDFAQTLSDMLNYKREKLGSKPPSKILLGKGITAKAMMTAFRLSEINSDYKDNNNLSRIVAIGSQNTDIDLTPIDLTSMSEFSEETSIPFGMFSIALGFGLDPSELWSSFGGGNSSANEIQQMRTRAKLPTEMVNLLSHQFNTKYLPPHLSLVFDFKDDSEDEQKAKVRDVRARNRVRNIASLVTDVRTERLNMMSDGDLTREEFIEMEADDGRLEDGTPIESIVYSKDVLINGDEGVLNLPLELNLFDLSDDDLPVLYDRLNRTLQKLESSRTNKGKLGKYKTVYSLLIRSINKIKTGYAQQIDKNPDYNAPRIPTPQRDGDQRGSLNSNRNKHTDIEDIFNYYRSNQ